MSEPSGGRAGREAGERAVERDYAMAQIREQLREDFPPPFEVTVTRDPAQGTVEARINLPVWRALESGGRVLTHPEMARDFARTAARQAANRFATDLRTWAEWAGRLADRLQLEHRARVEGRG